MSKTTKTDDLINRLKNIKPLAYLMVMGLVLIGIGSVTDAGTKIWNLLSINNGEVESVEYLIGISVENETAKEKKIFNFAEFYLTEEEGLMIREHPKGRTFLRKIWRGWFRKGLHYSTKQQGYLPSKNP